MSRILSGLLLAAWVLHIGGEVSGAEADRLRYLSTIYLDDKGGGMRQPEGVACNDKSTVIVADTGKSRLLRYTIDDRTVKPVGEIVAPEMSSPIRVQLTSKDEILALDGKQRRILSFSARGQLKGYLTPDGVPEPATIVPRGLAVDRTDALYILDVFGERVLVLDAGGKYIRQLPLPADHGFFSDVAVDARGAVYLLDSVRAAVHVARKDAGAFSVLARNLRAHLSFPTALVVDSRGIVYVVDQNGGGVVLLAQDGAVLSRQLAPGWTEGLVYYPSQLCLTDRGQVFIADRGNNRVQVFSVVR